MLIESDGSSRMRAATIAERSIISRALHDSHSHTLTSLARHTQTAEPSDGVIAKVTKRVIES